MDGLEEQLQAILSSPEAMEKIREAARNLTEPKPEADAMDPQMLSAALGVVQEYRSADDRRIRLLTALGAYVGEENREHVAKAIRIVKLAKAARRAMESFREGETGV